MSDDLVTRLLAAIEETERVAQAATPGPWRYNPNKHWHKPGTCWFEEAVFTGPAGKDAVCIAGTGETDHPEAMARAAHIAHNDPAAVLRRCNADRYIVESHPATAVFDPGSSEVPGFVCETCVQYDRYGFPMDDSSYPCTTLRKLAEGYGLEVGE
jgi:hypothetical protein